MSWKIPAKPFRRFHIRLSLVVTSAAALASALVFGLMLAFILKGFADQDHMELDSRLLSYWAAFQYGGTEAILDRAAIDMRGHGGRPFLLAVNDIDGGMVGAIVPGGWEMFNLDDEVLEGLSPGMYADLHDENAPYSLVVTGITLSDGTRLLIGLSTENREFLIRMYRRFLPWAMAAIVITGTAVGIISSRRLLRPIARLNREIDRIIVTGEFSRRLETRGTEDQLDGLVGRYNRLLDRVESLIGGIKETLGAVAHDLRTPLTRLRGRAELALRQENPEVYTEALGIVVEQTDQAGALLSALMDIAEAEQGMLSLEGRECNLSILAAEVCDMYEFVAEEKEQTLVLDAPDSVPLMGDPVRLRQILGNLVDNAVKYGPKGGRVDIRCGMTGDQSWVTVTDDGPGVHKTDAARVFDRLYRGDKSRGSRGLGLGLSMVKALVEAHKGSVELEQIPDRGACFRVVFPAFIAKG